MNKESEFKPTSKRFTFIDRYQKAYRNTLIQYQHGRVNGKKAMQLFYKGELIATRFKSGKARDTAFDIQAYGGQDIHKAQSQREECLQVIISRLFEKHGCKVEIEPKLGDFTPDMLITRGELEFFIELKAYHRENLCGDVEISQAMKYFEKASRLIEEHNEKLTKNTAEKPVPKTILITTADLIKERESYLGHPDETPRKYVKRFYKSYISPRKYVDTMDRFTAKMMYIHAAKKFVKNRKIGFRPMNVVFSHDFLLDEFPAFFFKPEEYDVLLMDAELTYNLLKREGLSTEAHYFKVLREAKLEKLVLNRKVLEIPK